MQSAETLPPAPGNIMKWEIKRSRDLFVYVCKKK